MENITDKELVEKIKRDLLTRYNRDFEVGIDEEGFHKSIYMINIFNTYCGLNIGSQTRESYTYKQLSEAMIVLAVAEDVGSDEVVNKLIHIL